MVWNTFAPLSYAQYGQIVGAGPLGNPDAYTALIQAAQHYNRDPRAMLVQLRYENQFGRDISQTQIANNNYAGIKYAGQSGASAGGVSPEGDQYAHFDSIGSFMLSLAQSLGWYVNTFPTRLNTYEEWTMSYPASGGNGLPGVRASGGDLPPDRGSGPFGIPTPGEIVSGVASGVTSGIKNALGSAFGSAGGILKGILSSDLVERGLLILVGLMLIGAGLSGLARSSGAVQTAAVAAAA